MILEFEEMDYIQCYNCDAEFKVRSLFESTEVDSAVMFCPFCGEEIDGVDEEDVWEEEEE